MVGTKNQENRASLQAQTGAARPSHKKSSVTHATDELEDANKPKRPQNRKRPQNIITEKREESTPKPTSQARPKTRRTGNSKTGWMLRDTAEALHTLSHNSLKSYDGVVSSVDGFDILCTYNWRNDGKVILVPGEPPKWLDRDLPFTLLPDSGLQFIDQNAFRVPKYPFEPVFQAMVLMNPGINLDDIDVIANRNSFRKFLDFAAGRRQDPFRMDLHLVNNTLFISRREKTARNMIYGAANSGYGHNFEKSFTQPGPGLEHSSSHHRVIQYHLGPLKCAVRFEVDAYYENPASDAQTEAGVQELADVMSSIKLDDATADKSVARGTRVLKKGTIIDSAKLAEIKAKKSEKINQAIPQLWFGRTSYLITGQHKDGVVHKVSCTNVSQRFSQWEAANQEALRKLVQILLELKNVMRSSKGGAAALVCLEKGAPIQIMKMRTATNVLPEDIIRRHWTTDSDEVKQAGRV